MSTDIVMSEIEKAIQEVKSRGVVLKRGNTHVLVGSYQWRAAVIHLIEDHSYLEDHSWCSMECFARFCFGSAHAAKVSMARDRVPSLARELREHGHILLIAYDGPNGAKSAMRIWKRSDDIELVKTQLETMERMRDLTQDKLDQIMTIVRSAAKPAEEASDAD